MLYLQPEICESIKRTVHKLWPEKKVRYFCKPKSWSSNRSIQVSTPLQDWNLFYIYNDGNVNLHIEPQAVNDHEDLIRFIRKSNLGDNKIRWHKWNGMQQGFCCYEKELNSETEIIEALSILIDFFDPIIKGFIKENPILYPPKIKAERYNESYSFSDPKEDVKLDTCILPVGHLNYGVYEIPPYQRPYKWIAKNVNQLISDILEFHEQSSYRLGTLVLNDNHIVDGQQRLLTLSLILTNLVERFGDDRRFDNYRDFFAGLKKFCDSTKFQNPYSLHNLVENMNTIVTREQDMGIDTLNFILNRCEFVKVELDNISEAFQFFDSQNARGKDLAAHDLLKAFHLREIDDMSKRDSENIDKWQHQQTKELTDLFLSLYRAKCWAQGKTARFFTKEDTNTFKGVSLSEGKRYPFYRLEIIAHVYTTYYMSSPDRIVDSNNMEYPFNLDDQIINGSRFFDMIRYYSDLYKKIKSKETYRNYHEAEKIINTIDSYNGSERTGDKYIRNMFFTLLLYYVDRFGYEELDKIVVKFFIWAYSLRLKNQAVQLVMMDNYAKSPESIFRTIHDSRTPYDIINVSQECLESYSCTKCEEIIEKFIDLKKLKSND